MQATKNGWPHRSPMPATRLAKLRRPRYGLRLHPALPARFPASLVIIERFVQAHDLAEIDEFPEVKAAMANRCPDVATIGHCIARPPGKWLVQLAGRRDILLQFFVGLAQSRQRIFFACWFLWVGVNGQMPENIKR